MDRRTILAVVLSVVVITVGMTIQSLLAPEPALSDPQVQQDRPAPTTTTTDDGTDQSTNPQVSQPVTTAAPLSGTITAAEEESLSSQQRVYENQLIRVTLDPAGATIASFQLLEHLDGEQPVDMVNQGSEDRRAMTLHFGDYQAPPVTDLFDFVQIDANTFEFSRDFYVVGQEETPFTLVRRYEFAAGEYMFRTSVEITNPNSASAIPLNFEGIAYSLQWGPQIGPEFEALDQRTEFRRYIIYDDGDKDQFNRVRAGAPEIVDERISWASISGKYFAVVGLADNRDLTTVFAQEPVEGLAAGSQLYLMRPQIRASFVEDEYLFYAGPKTPGVLTRYDRAENNVWGRNDLNLTEILETRVLLGWLENILKWILQMIVRVIPNYGIAIIILTILVKAALYPLTRKSYESNAKMQAVQPKVKELKEKYKDNQQKQNEEMAKLYKKEGVNPLGGCLPLLAQFPFFLAMFGLFNNHFDLRGATFISGWITDLSAPDVLLSFGDFTLPLLGWEALRGLPIIFVGTQLLSTKFTQSATGSGSSGQMKFMQYGLPLIFFFILYNMPSGLLVYWIFSNVLTVGQQYYSNKKKERQPPDDPKTKKRPKRS